jgi:hypothetical protein
VGVAKLVERELLVVLVVVVERDILVDVVLVNDGVEVVVFVDELVVLVDDIVLAAVIDA